MRKTTIHTVDVPPVSRAYAQDLAKRFPPIEITANTPESEIRYNAGMQKVVKFVQQTSSHREIIGDSNRLKQDTKQSAWQKLFGVNPKVR